ncbi:ankyrin [Choiromyces venosus 120613-1]|uniref:Ankyrin n=1 Tax=Choiromyces venosus 120613-1 TaxID=1336337 RepID=A0A3N4JAM4_9PEZI|nr:ankyrin [Choiromyces venosus 120613-1]
MPSSNIWIAASDNDIHSVATFLTADPTSVNSKDENGYTPLHAAVSYNHIPLLRSLVRTHGGDVNAQDVEGDTPLFVAETVEVARILVEELGADVGHKNLMGLSAADTIEEDGQFPLVAAYLRGLEAGAGGGGSGEDEEGGMTYPKPPPGISVDLSAAEDTSETLPPVDDALRRKIEELATREDFNSEETQRELRSLVTQAVHDHVMDTGEEEERSVRPRQEGGSN